MLLAMLSEEAATRFEWILLIAGAVLSLTLLAVLIYVFTRKEDR